MFMYCFVRPSLVTMVTAGTSARCDDVVSMFSSTWRDEKSAASAMSPFPDCPLPILIIVCLLIFTALNRKQKTNNICQNLNYFNILT